MRSKSAFITFYQTAGTPLEPGSEREDQSLAMIWATVTRKLDRIEELVQQLPSGR